MELEKVNASWSFDGHTTRIVERADGSTEWIAKDVCEVLELSKVDSATRMLDDDEKGTHIVSTPGGNQEMTTVTESGLYTLIMRSRKPEAKRFKRWVTHEVLPSIRKTGAYMVPSVAAQAAVDPQVAVVLAQTLLDKAMQNEAVARVNEMSNTMRHLQAENADLRWRLMRAEPEAEANIRRRQNISSGMTRSWQRRKGILPAEDKKRTRHGSIQILP